VSYVWLAVGTLICAAGAIRARNLLHSTLWLAGTSALVAVVLYGAGARQAGVIELSVGAGLVTVLLVFAIGIAGLETMEGPPSLPVPLLWSLVLVPLALLAGLALPILSQFGDAGQQPLGLVLWQQRTLDVLGQIVIIFIAALGVLGLAGGRR
jgi:NADH:ubiquinone oxidoreductase subunit 6 (subunit J)